jgi:hypothetical protein|tara:strand:- start:348 stop:593 length:246 start_codon:yes stop_codon:yes gene_type:complete
VKFSLTPIHYRCLKLVNCIGDDGQKLSSEATTALFKVMIEIGIVTIEKEDGPFIIGANTRSGISTLVQGDNTDGRLTEDWQ